MNYNTSSDISERNAEDIIFEKKGDKIFLRESQDVKQGDDDEGGEDDFLGPYDKIINCLGFDVSA